MHFLTPTTDLEAVNALLENIGEAPVSSLDDLALDASHAQNTLFRVSREVQTKGWHWNTSVRKLTRDSNKEFLLPSNTVRVDTIGPSQLIDVVMRGGKLYDRRNYKNTTVFEEREIHVEMVQVLGFEELPEAARQYIYIRASRIFQEQHAGSPLTNQFDQRDEYDALATLRDDDNRSADGTFIDNMSRTTSRIPINWRI